MSKLQEAASMMGTGLKMTLGDVADGFSKMFCWHIKGLFLFLSLRGFFQKKKKKKKNIKEKQND
jgi:hypothetical protein